MNSFFLRAVCLFGAIAFLNSSWSNAQVAQTTDPGRIEQQFDLPETTEDSTPIEIPKSEDFGVPPGAEGKNFELKSLTIEGTTVYQPKDLEPLYVEVIDQVISLKDLYKIAQNITTKYRQDGYILSIAVIPEQVIEAGEVKIQVIEGYIEAVEIQDAPANSEAQIKRFLDAIRKDRPLNIKALERYLLLANDLAGMEVRSILRRGSTLGTATLIAKVNYDPIEPFFEFTNRGSAEVGNLRLQVGSAFNSMFGQGEKLTLRAATTPERVEELALGSIDLNVPIGNDGLTLNLGAVYTEVNPGEQLRLNDINGRSVFAEIGASYPLIRSRTTNLYLGGGFDYSDTQNISDVPTPGLILSQDHLAVLRLNVDGNKQDSSGIIQGGIELSQGIAGTTPNNPTLPLSRAQGSAVFTKLAFNISRLQKLPANLVGVLQAKAQLSGDSLLVREQFGLGGATFGSAFNPDKLLGDYGFGVRAELQRPFFYQGFGRSLGTLPYVFSDIGKVYRHQPTAIENNSDTLSSAGFGVRQTFGDELRLAMEVAFPLERSDAPVDYEPRFFFSLTGYF